MKPSCVESSELNAQDTFVTLKKIQTAPVEQNGSLKNALTFGPMPFSNPTLLKNPRASSTSSLPLVGIRPVQPDPIPSPLAASFSSNSSSSPLASVLLNSVFVGDFHPLIPQIGPRFRASSCHPLGRLIMNPVDAAFCWPSVSRTAEDGPLDLSNKLSFKPEIESQPLPTNNSRLSKGDPEVVADATVISSVCPASISPGLATRTTETETTSTDSVLVETTRTRRRRATASRRPFRTFARDCSQSEQDSVRTSATPSQDISGRFSGLSDTEDYKTKTSPVPANASNRTSGRRSQSASDNRAGSTHRPVDSDPNVIAGSDSSSLPETCHPIRTAQIVPRRRLSTGVGSDQAVCNPRMRRYPEMTPSEVKDEAYWDKRVKNNEAARRSRRARKSKEQSLRDYAERLETTNAKLLEEIKLLREEVLRLKSEAVKKNGETD